MTRMSPQEMQSHCAMGSEEMVARLPHGQAAIMLAQQPKVNPLIAVDYGAEETCNINVQGHTCSFDNIRTTCCDIFSIGVRCQGDQQCAQNGLMSLPPAELQWFQTQAQQGGGMPQVCPGIAAMTRMSPQEMQSHCTMGSEEMVARLPHGQAAIMLAQQPKVNPLIAVDYGAEETCNINVQGHTCSFDNIRNGNLILGEIGIARHHIAITSSGLFGQRGVQI
jgi:hypothetical protein